MIPKTKTFVFAILVLYGCGNKENEKPIMQGVFIDSPVENLKYTIDGNLYFTDASGQFSYTDGDTITFSIGQITFPSVYAEHIITPMTIAGTTNLDNPMTINISRLLISLDVDNNPDNGITISSQAEGAAYDVVDFNVDTSIFAQNPVIQEMLNLTGNSLASTSSVRSHLHTTNERINNPSVIGAWRKITNDTFQYLLLFNDGKFFYAEYDPDVESDLENGLEVGEYSYSMTNGNFSFNLSYDDNDPGNGSGVGDIGLPSVIDAVLTNGNHQLSIADGELVLDYVSFSTTSIAGAWQKISGQAFQYLVLFSDNTFVYAENDPDATSKEDNGLEVGTYSYSNSTGNITFSITYDDNDPNNDSGIGDIGTPATYHTQLSQDNQTMDFAGFVFTRIL